MNGIDELFTVIGKVPCTAPPRDAASRGISRNGPYMPHMGEIMTTPFAQKSRKTRRQVERKAWLADNDDFALRQCVVVDMSGDGARLKIDDTVRLPRRFRLTFSRSTRDGLRCDLRWRRGQSAGVKFVA